MADRMSVERAREIISAHKESLNAFGRQYCRCSECDMAEGFIKGHSQQSEQVWQLVKSVKRFISERENPARDPIMIRDTFNRMKADVSLFVEKEESGE